MKLNSRPKRVQRDESLIILTLITKDDARPLNAIQLINYTIDTIGVNHLYRENICFPFYLILKKDSKESKEKYRKRGRLVERLGLV